MINMEIILIINLWPTSKNSGEATQRYQKEDIASYVDKGIMLVYREKIQLLFLKQKILKLLPSNRWSVMRGLFKTYER